MNTNSEEYETIAGLFLSLHEDIPEKGESIKYENKLLVIDGEVIEEDYLDTIENNRSKP